MQIWKICPLAEFERQKALGTFSGCGIDLDDGYIHFSPADLLRDTLKLWFKGQADLVIFSVDSAKMPGLKWEEARKGQSFPHVYGQFPFSEVQDVHTVSVDESGHVEGLRVEST